VNASECRFPLLKRTAKYVTQQISSRDMIVLRWTYVLHGSVASQTRTPLVSIPVVVAVQSTVEHWGSFPTVQPPSQETEILDFLSPFPTSVRPSIYYTSRPHIQRSKCPRANFTFFVAVRTWEKETRSRTPLVRANFLHQHPMFSSSLFLLYR
jgi:hypothetical protein